MKEGQYRRPLALALSDFTNAILTGFDSAFISDNEKQMNKLRSQLRKVMKTIAKSSNEAAKEAMASELQKLKTKDINKGQHHKDEEKTPLIREH